MSVDKMAESKEVDLPLVSVIIPVYNGERYLAEAIDSVFAQDYHPFEIIVVDDGSVDDTADIAKLYKDDVRYIYQSNQGHAAAKNTGISVAEGEFIAFLDADDLWAPHKLRAQIGFLIENPEIGYVISRMRVFLEPGARWPYQLDEEYFASDPAGYLPSTLVVKKHVLGEIGTFDTGYRHANDSDWFFRAKDAGVPMAVLQDVLVYRRLHSSNMSYEAKANLSELLRVVRSSVKRDRG